ncbi:MAG: DUF1566 domain-containing protein [Thermodesulfobacteriota bacterium]|nr:DUF1566 domain-containing protein [Thermodesulfobacteriota bacterium]
MRQERVIQLLTFIVVWASFLLPVQAANTDRTVAPILPLLLSGSVTMQEKIPSLALMVAKDTDKIEMAWVPGSDGVTPVDQVEYKIYLSTSEDFTLDASTLKKTVTGVSQTEITGLIIDTLYFGKIVAEYFTSASNSSNSLQAKTYKYEVQVDNSTQVAKAADLGLGKHTTTDGTTYTYAGGTPPTPGNALFSEDTAGGMTLRTVDSASSSGGAVTVYTSDASLTDVLDRGSIFSSFQLFDIAAQAKDLPAGSQKIATAKSFTRKDGSKYSRIEWENSLLAAEQTDYAYNEEGLIVLPQGKSSIIKLIEPKAVESSFTATVTAEFEPQLISSAEWGGTETVFKQLYSAKVAAKGILSLTALAEYNFSAEGKVSKSFTLFDRTWMSVYTAGPVPVYQEVTLSMDVVASASAAAEIKALAQANLTETVEVGARYNGSSWIPYIIHNEASSLTASLDIVGQASAEIRLIPKIEVEFYKVASGSLTVEPLAGSSLTFEETTNNLDFLAAHPGRLIQLTSFDAFLGLESKVAVSLGTLGYNWDILPSTCVLGTGSCTYPFDPISLFSIPALKLSITSFTVTQTDLKFEVTDGTYNPLSENSITWEAFPDDSTITPGTCTKSKLITTCTATFVPSTAKKYTVFASAHGDSLGEMSRQYKEVDIGGGCPTGDQTVVTSDGHEWQRCDDGTEYNYADSVSYCDNLNLDDHSDWRLPDLGELKSLVVCTNGCPVPLRNLGSHPDYCGDNTNDPECTNDYDRPTIDPSFQCRTSAYGTSTLYGTRRWSISFTDGGMGEEHLESRSYVRCIRN